jgi:hypothetical protein
MRREKSVIKVKILKLILRKMLEKKKRWSCKRKNAREEENIADIKNKQSSMLRNARPCECRLEMRNERR